jgi:hypothetical protein
VTQDCGACEVFGDSRWLGERSGFGRRARQGGGLLGGVEEGRGRTACPRRLKWRGATNGTVMLRQMGTNDPVVS